MWCSISINWLFFQIIPKRDIFIILQCENGLLFNEIKSKIQCKISAYLNVILHFKPFFAEKLQKQGKSHIFGIISEKSQ